MTATGRLKIVLAVVAGILAVLIGVGIYGLTRPAPAPRLATSGPTTAPTVAPAAPADESELDTADALEFASAVAGLLYGWDTAETGRQQFIDQLLAVGDGAELNGLASDLERHLPQPAVWEQLTDMRAAQTLTVEDLSMPQSWAAVVADNDLPDGFTALTLTGTRHRTGTWLDEPVASDHPVALTLFLACPPAQDSCRLLRLSEPDHPLP